MNDAEKLLELAEAKSTIKQIKDDLKVMYPEKVYKPWVAEYIYCIAYNGETVTEIAKKINVGRTAIYKRIDNNVKKYISEIREKIFIHRELELNHLVGKSVETLAEIIESGDTDATRLKAIETVLKNAGIINDKKLIELIGTIDIPNITITSEKV